MTLNFSDYGKETELSESIFRSVCSVCNDLKQNLIHSVVVLDQDIVTFKKTQCRKHYKLLFQRASCVEHASLHGIPANLFTFIGVTCFILRVPRFVVGVR